MKKQATGEGFVKVTKMETPEDFEKTDIYFLGSTDKEELATYLENGPLWTTSDDSWNEEGPQEVEGNCYSIRVVSVEHNYPSRIEELKCKVSVEEHTAVENDEGVWVDDIAFC